VKGLPQHGFPYAVATAQVRIDPTRPGLVAHVLRVDPRVVRAAGSAGTSETTPTVASFFDAQHPPHGTEIGVWLSGAVFLPSDKAPAADATLLVAGQPLAHATADNTRAAIGIHDEDGMLEWIELPSDGPADAATLHAMDSLLSHDGCGTRLFVDGSARVLLGGSLDLDGAKAAVPAGTTARLVRGTAPAARPYFESTPIVGPAVWQPLQRERVRYFPKAAKRPPPAAVSGSASGPAPPSPPASVP
jgi:hypothetical protein